MPYYYHPKPLLKNQHLGAFRGWAPKFACNPHCRITKHAATTFWAHNGAAFDTNLVIAYAAPEEIRTGLRMAHPKLTVVEQRNQVTVAVEHKIRLCSTGRGPAVPRLLQAHGREPRQVRQAVTR